VGALRVRVPVLSKATCRTPPSRSKAAPLVMIIPNLLAAPIAETTVTGTAIASAQGEAATSTTSARVIHTSGSPSSDPITATSSERIITPGTSGRAMRSARRARSPFSAWACSTIPTMVARELSAQPAVVVTSSDPVALTDPAATGSPGATATGIDSPVIADVSRLLWPVRTMPSVATRSPGRTRSIWPVVSSRAGISTATPSRTTVAIRGTRSNSARSPRRARSIALSSSASAIE